MMIPQMLTPELSRNSCRARSRAGGPRALLCLIGMLGSALACSGTIDDNQDVGSARPATSETANGRSNAAPNVASPVGASSGTASAADETAPSDLRVGERSTDDIVGVRGGSRASGGGSRGGGSRASDREKTSDAGDADAGDADAGEADAGEVDVDVDVIEIDAGQVGDAGVAFP